MEKQQALRMGKRAEMLALLVVAMAIGTALAAPAPAPTPSIVGDWQGSLNAGGGSLRIVIHILSDKDGKLTATMDSPDQGATGIEVTSVTFKAPDLHLEIERIGGSYDGKSNDDNSEITGNWKQGIASLPLILKRVRK